MFLDFKDISFGNFQQPQVLQLKLRKPKNKREVKWTTDTVDNEHMNKKKSKCKFMLSIKFFQLSVLINAAGRNMQNYYIVFQVYKTKTAEGKYVLHVLFSDKNLKNKKMLCRMFSYNVYIRGFDFHVHVLVCHCLSYLRLLHLRETKDV